METYIVRQPILDHQKNVFAYEVLWRPPHGGYVDKKDIAAADAIENFISEINNEKFLDGKVTFLTFTPNLLMKNIPKMFDPDKLVIQLDDSAIVHPLAQRMIYRYKKQGYRIAVTNFEFAPRYFKILDVVDYIKVDFTNLQNPSLKNIAGVGDSLGKTIIAYNVNSHEASEKAMVLGCTYIQGAEVAQQFTSRVHRLEHMQSNFFMLMVAITRDEPNVDEITDIISRDVTLAFSLIKLVNSAYFALRNRVKSVKQALTILGLGQLKEWIYLLSFKEGENDFSDELVRISFLRGHFCSELAPYLSQLPISRSEAYLMGMFSTLGSLLDVPLESALAELSLSDEVKQALITGEGVCGGLYRLVQYYEGANWKGLCACAEELNVPMSIVTQKYFECVEYVNNIWRTLHSPSTHQMSNSDGSEERDEGEEEYFQEQLDWQQNNTVSQGEEDETITLEL